MIPNHSRNLRMCLTYATWGERDILLLRKTTQLSEENY
jgi:hypothetical protein